MNDIFLTHEVRSEQQLRRDDSCLILREEDPIAHSLTEGAAFLVFQQKIEVFIALVDPVQSNDTWALGQDLMYSDLLHNLLGQRLLYPPLHDHLQCVCLFKGFQVGFCWSLLDHITSEVIIW
jgi:hypothetical protein